ncbi:MAG: SLC13 family permease, partial [Acidobacteriota bacterium]
QGPRDRLSGLSVDTDLLLLMPKEQFDAPPRPGKGRVAFFIFLIAILIAIFFPQLTGPAMLGGAILMILTRVVTSEQAYGAIGWKAVVIIAGMLPLGIALSKPFGPESVKAADLIGKAITTSFGGFGTFWIVVGTCLFAAVLTQVINSGVIAAVVAPIAISIAYQIGVEPRSVVMGLAVACSIPFATPLGHPVNLLIMGPGGYSFGDFAKSGIPLAIISFIVGMIALATFWRF